jgi:hypothetical protein
MKTISILAVSMLLSMSVFADTKSKDVVETEAVFAVANAKTIQLTGSILDSKNQETLVGATLHVGGKKYYSNLEGAFSISDIKPGKHQIKVEFISYKPTIIEVDVNNNEGINIYLHQN